MNDLKRSLSEAAAAAFEAAGLPPEFGRVTASDRPDLADFQCNGALAAAKSAKRNPREIAVQVVDILKGDPRLASVEIAGVGFINMRVSDEALSARAREIAADERAGAHRLDAPRRVLVDYAGPNVAKPMHVGHLRASIIGESIKRLYRFRGDEVVGDAHFGDWGFQMGLLISALMDEDAFIRALMEKLPEAPRGFSAADEAKLMAEFDSRITLADLDRVYPAASQRQKEDPAFKERARKATAELQNGRFGYRLLWRHFVKVSRVGLEREFHALGVDFDLWKGESDVNDLIEPMVHQLAVKGLLVEDQGARIVRVARETDKRDVPPLLVVSSEGSAMYGTTDLATILDRRKSFDPHLILYCVDQRQADHFETVFRAAYLAGYAEEGSLEHIGFGTMNGADGKPRPEAARPDRDGPREGARAPARSRARRRADRGPVRGHGPQGRGRGVEVRRPAELPRHLLRLRPRPLHQLRGQDRPVPAVPVGPHQERAAPRGRGRRERGPGRDP